MVAEHHEFRDEFVSLCATQRCSGHVGGGDGVVDIHAQDISVCQIGNAASTTVFDVGVQPAQRAGQGFAFFGRHDQHLAQVIDGREEPADRVAR